MPINLINNNNDIYDIQLDKGNYIKFSPLRGGILTNWVSNHKEIIYFDQKRFLEKTKSIRGGIPILFPICGDLERNSLFGESYIDLMASLLASELYRNSLSGINFATKTEVYEIATLLEMTSDISFTKISYEGLKDEIVNTSEELIDYYDKNQVLFFSEEERQFQYFVLDPIDYKNNIQIPEDYVENSYKDYLSNFDNSTQTRISHIMIDKNNLMRSLGYIFGIIEFLKFLIKKTFKGFF